MKKKLKNNITLLNSISSLMLQFLTIVSGFIIPKLILNTFGSEVNGLVSSLNQFLGYINLLEGGVTGVITASLYKPIVQKNKEKISSILKTTNKFYKKISIIFIIYSIGLAVVYPFLFKTNFSYQYIFSLTLILSITLFIQYMFSLSLRTLLIADKKVYIVSFVQIIILILNVTLFYIIIKVYPNIHILKLVTGMLYIIQPLVFNKVVNKYFDIDKNAKEDSTLLKSRWDGFAINIAYFVHSNTDVAVLTLITNLKVVSVYAVYSLVTTGIKKLISAFSSGIAPTMGTLYAKGDKKELDNKFELYEYTMFMLVFFFFTVGALLITPFVQIYTKNITDVNYNQFALGVLLMIAEGIACIREPYVNLAYSANKFKDLKWPAYIEAGLNIITSIILVFKFGVIGVAIGTLIAMAYRTLFQVFYFKNNVLNRSVKIFFKKLVLFSISTGFGIFICGFFLPCSGLSIINWCVKAVIYSLIIGILLLTTSFIFFKDDLRYFMKKYFKIKI